MPRMILSLAFILLSCGEPSPHSQTHIIAGTATKAPKTFVSLFLKGEAEPFCGGAYIGEGRVLTAAHCVARLDDEIELRIGLDTLPSPSEPIPIEAIFVHPRYHAQQITFDIALIFVKAGAIRRQGLTIAEQAPPGSDLMVYGFGTTDPRGEAYPTRLQRASLSELPLSLCRARGPAFVSIKSDQICALDPNDGPRDSCYGDSGGPLLYGDQLYGLVSWGLSCGLAGSPGIYTRASAFRDWAEADRDESDLSERMSAIFYFPLLSPSQGKHFSAQGQTWKTPTIGSEEVALESWERRFRGRDYRIRLVRRRPGLYSLRLKQGRKEWETAVHFTELNRQK